MNETLSWYQNDYKLIILLAINDVNFTCSCPEGYEISSFDKTRCDDIDECDASFAEANLAPCNEAESCYNFDGGYECVCDKVNSTFRDGRCQVEDPCETFPCGKLRTCVLDADKSPRCELNIGSFLKASKNLSDKISNRLGSIFSPKFNRNSKRLENIESEFKKYLVSSEDPCKYEIDALSTVLKFIESKLDVLTDAEIEEHALMLKNVFGGKMLCLDDIGHEFEMKIDRKLRF